MYTNRLSNQTQWYVPYFYQTHIIQDYLEQGKSKVQASQSSTGDYDFTSDLIKPKKTYVRTQTIEGVIQKGYFAIPKAEPEFAIISDKKHTSRLGLADIISQIQNRYETYKQNIYELEISKCAAISSLHEHEAHHGPPTSRVEYSVNKRLDRLYSEQREERVNLWQDISKLRQLLPEHAQKYLSAYRKVAILENEEGDSL